MERAVGRIVGVVALDIIERGSKFRERGFVQPALLLQAVMHDLGERAAVARRAGDGDDGDTQRTAARHRQQRGIDPLARQIPGAAEQHQCVGPCSGACDLAGAERHRHPAVQFKHVHV